MNRMREPRADREGRTENGTVSRVAMGFAIVVLALIAAAVLILFS